MRLLQMTSLKKPEAWGIYFMVLLCSISFLATLLYNGHVQQLDIILLIAVCVPFIFKNKTVHILFGTLYVLCGCLIGLSCLKFHITLAHKQPAIDFIMGYLLAAGVMLSGLLMVYPKIKYERPGI
ncbi:MAG TPA: hypothetical protein PKE30_10960 [Niabella sp.]|nr:hypothetical protein [Niabella sp.]